MPSHFLKKQEGFNCKIRRKSMTSSFLNSRKWLHFLQNEYTASINERNRKLPFGKELYATYTKQWTTTEMAPEEIHALGLKVARLQCKNGKKIR
jgi:uncharacterized protein (DUF885 family)